MHLFLFKTQNCQDLSFLTFYSGTSGHALNYAHGSSWLLTLRMAGHAINYTHERHATNLYFCHQIAELKKKLNFAL